MLFVKFYLLIALLIMFAFSNAAEVSFPLQFTANIEITANLVDPSSEYPPRVRVY